MRSLVAVAAVAATATALAVAPAMADPVNVHFKGITPQRFDVIGAGSNTTQFLVDQLAYNFDKGQNARHIKDTPTNPLIYSWDAVPPNNPTNNTQVITVKPGCSKQLRPAGSGAGIAALGTFGTTTFKGHKYPCVAFARSSRARKSSDPPFAKGGVAFVILAQDAVTYATTSNSNAPKSLTMSQLKNIFNCTFTKWSQVGVTGAAGSQTIDPIIPQLTSGTLSFWYTALGLGTAAGEPACSKLAGLTKGLPEENQGLSKYFHVGNNVHAAADPNVITLFSVGQYISQAFHSKLCGKTAPKRGQNAFGCNATGVLTVRAISGKAPFIKLRGAAVPNPAFPALFRRFLFDVVPFATNTSNHISKLLNRYFGAKGFFCSASQKSAIEAYGFLPTRACGLTE